MPTINHIELMQKTFLLRVILLSQLMLCVAAAFSTLATPAVFAASQSGETSWVGSDSVRILAKSPSSGKKIMEGIYWVGSEGRGIKVKARQYQYYDEQVTDKWKPTSELTYIRKGVFLLEGTYWCLSPMPRNLKIGSCTASGWK